MSRAALLLIMFAACGGTEPTPQPEAPAPAPAPAVELTEAQTVAWIAKAIQADPARADAVLAEHSMSRADLDAALWRIASNAEDARVYREALGR